MKSSPPVHVDQVLANPGADKRLDILRLIGECGSISQAGRQAGVSYKAAWQAVDTLGNLAGTPLVEKAVGGAGGGGARLTDAGRHLLQAAALMAQAQRQVLGQLALGRLRAPHGPARALPALALRTSMRNQLPCTVAALKPTAGMVVVRLRVADGIEVTSRITRESVQLLGLARGRSVLALFKATAVHVSRTQGLDTRVNCLPGTVARAGRSAGASEVAVTLANGANVVGFAPPGHALRKGMEAVAMVDASSVVIGLTE